MTAKPNILIAQSGGPTAVINAGVCGVIQTAQLAAQSHFDLTCIGIPQAFDLFINEKYDGPYQKKLIEQFNKHLPKEPPWTNN